MSGEPHEERPLLLLVKPTAGKRTMSIEILAETAFSEVFRPKSHLKLCSNKTLDRCEVYSNCHKGLVRNRRDFRRWPRAPFSQLHGRMCFDHDSLRLKQITSYRPCSGALAFGSGLLHLI